MSSEPNDVRALVAEVIVELETGSFWVDDTGEHEIAVQMRRAASVLTVQAETIARLARENGKLRELAAGLANYAYWFDNSKTDEDVINRACEQWAREADGDQSESLAAVDAHLARKEGTP